MEDFLTELYKQTVMDNKEDVDFMAEMIGEIFGTLASLLIKKEIISKEEFYSMTTQIREKMKNKER